MELRLSVIYDFQRIRWNSCHTWGELKGQLLLPFILCACRDEPVSELSARWEGSQ